MKFISFFLIVVLSFSSCSPDIEPDQLSEDYEIIIIPTFQELAIYENGRIKLNSSENDSIYDLSYQLFDSDCVEIDSYSNMNLESIPEVILPNLSEGTYYYKLGIRGVGGIDYDTASHFTIKTDTIMEVNLKNSQMRYRFLESSSFDNSDVHHVNYSLNFSSAYKYDYRNCRPGEWRVYDSDGYVDESSYVHPFNTGFKYEYPIDIKSVTVKFYDNESNVLKIHNIPIIKELQKHHSYTFEINLSTIWSDNSNGNLIEINLIDVEWIEETINLN